jgi:hypothetical protein
MIELILFKLKKMRIKVIIFSLYFGIRTIFLQVLRSMCHRLLLQSVDNPSFCIPEVVTFYANTLFIPC